MNSKHHTQLMRQAVDLAHANRLQGGRPFGAVLALGDEVIATGVNNIIASHDPSTHAEMEAIRAGTQKRANPSLAGLSIYASGHPCPMCLAALVMNGAEQVFFAFDNEDAAPYGLSSEGTYQRLRLSLTPPPLPITRIDTGITAAQLYGDAPWPQDGFAALWRCTLAAGLIRRAFFKNHNNKTALPAMRACAGQ